MKTFVSSALLLLAACRASAPPIAPTAVAAAPVATSAANRCEDDHPVAVRVVRLAHSELVNQLSKALGQEVVSGPGAPVFHLQGDHLHPATERVFNSVDLGAYRNAARSLASRYVQSLEKGHDCLDPAQRSACVHGALKTLMLQLHRGQLDTADWSRIKRTHAALAASHGPAAALEGVVIGTLLSPQILFRTEAGVQVGPDRELQQSEAIQFASFAFLGGAPDSVDAAELARFSGPAFSRHLSRVARQWTRTPAFKNRASEFVEEWLGVSHLRDKLVRPTIGGEGASLDMAAVLVAEFTSFVKTNLLADDGDFARFFTATETTYDPQLEKIYNGRFVPPDRIVWDERERKGVLGLAGVLSAHASEQASDPVQRGMLVRMRILCEPMPPPIPNADLGKVGITPQMQTRERFEALAAAPACRSCHTVINPPGYLFESFDQHGRFRQVEKGRPLNDSGGLPAFFGKEYEGTGNWSGITQLADWLSSAPQPRLCFARDFSNYVLSARVFDRTESCGLAPVAARFVKTGRIADLVEDLVASEVFRRRIAGLSTGGGDLHAAQTGPQ